MATVGNGSDKGYGVVFAITEDETRTGNGKCMLLLKKQHGHVTAAVKELQDRSNEKHKIDGNGFARSRHAKNYRSGYYRGIKYYIVTNGEEPTYHMWAI